MNKIGRIAFIALAVCGAAGGFNSGQAIQQIDFRNYSFPWFEGRYPGSPEGWAWINRPSRSTIRVADGRYSFGTDPNGPLVTFQSVTYGDLTGPGQSDAAADLIYHSGGTCQWHYLYAYTLRQGTPRLLGVLRSGDRGSGGLANVKISKNRLVLDFLDTTRRVGDCCSEGYVRVHYRLQDGRFAEEGPRQRGDVAGLERPGDNK